MQDPYSERRYVHEPRIGPAGKIAAEKEAGEAALGADMLGGLMAGAAHMPAPRPPMPPAPSRTRLPAKVDHPAVSGASRRQPPHPAAVPQSRRPPCGRAWQACQRRAPTRKRGTNRPPHRARTSGTARRGSARHDRIDRMEPGDQAAHPRYRARRPRHPQPRTEGDRFARGSVPSRRTTAADPAKPSNTGCPPPASDHPTAPDSTPTKSTTPCGRAWQACQRRAPTRKRGTNRPPHRARTSGTARRGSARHDRIDRMEPGDQAAHPRYRARRPRHPQPRAAGTGGGIVTEGPGARCSH